MNDVLMTGYLLDEAVHLSEPADRFDPVSESDIEAAAAEALASELRPEID